MKKVFIAKLGIERLFYECICILPINMIISFTLWAVFNKQTTVFIFSFIIINLLWVIRNSFVIFKNGKIEFRTVFFGKSCIVECSHATELRLIHSKELLKIIRNTTQQNPVKTNCLSIFLPQNNVIAFKDQNYSTVLISVYKSNKLLSLIEKFTEDNQSTALQQNKQSVAPIPNYNGSRTEKYFINVPLGNHIKCYFKSFIVTILSPAVLSAVLSFAFSKIFPSLDFRMIFIILFIIHSAWFYVFEINLIVQNKLVAAIKLNCYANKATPAIMYQYIKDVHYISSIEEQQNILNTKQNIIKTPHPDYFWENVIYIELENGTVALLSIHNHEKLYNHLKQYLINKENSL
ncbi:MAG: hypothetical protein HFJ98_07865 [Eubacterium sp.]|nr:hypothetical protein [Eubacterium sp.]